jgi:hypothetical protein
VIVCGRNEARGPRLHADRGINPDTNNNPK